LTPQMQFYEKLRFQYNAYISNIREFPALMIVDAADEIVTNRNLFKFYSGNMDRFSGENAEWLAENYDLKDLAEDWREVYGVLEDVDVYTIMKHAQGGHAAEIDSHNIEVNHRGKESGAFNSEEPGSQTDLQSEQRFYRAKICVYGEPGFPQFEDFTATDDVDAMRQIYELCDEIEVMLLEVHELDKNKKSIWEIDLRFHDPEAHRFMDVDIIGFLGDIADKTIIHYPGDYKYDVEKFWKVALSENPQGQRFMWHCSGYGTHTLPEDEVFIKSTGSHGYWVDYRPKESDMVGYVVEITGHRDETVVGNVYDVGHYYSHSQYVRENSLLLDAVSLSYSNDWGVNAGKTITVPRYHYDDDRHRLMSESGSVVKIQYHPSESSRTMASLLSNEQANRMAMPIGDISEHLRKLDEKLIKLRGLPVPKQEKPGKHEELLIYHADFTDPEIPERMEIIVAKDDADALRQANEICCESEGVVLTGLCEVDDNADTREVTIPTQEDEIMPDPTISVAERNAYGYDYEGMLPLSKECAVDLFDKGHVVFRLYTDGTEGMVDDMTDFSKHDGIFGTERESWEQSEEYKDVVAILKRVDDVRNRRVDLTTDSLLKITADSLKSGIAERYIRPIIDSTLSGYGTVKAKTEKSGDKSPTQAKQETHAKPEKPKPRRDYAR